ncbi:metal ABC transporter solute-binding protein, Zn/Mn family [Paenibacillus bouchesdurhonensis]|uniref:metal ABC transporter solute-binding protein, Zn/Mn family n=1 Tax=Paenibacillus bouchesdurhonensis TaxID=1870990 RepID=UPI001F22D1CB|nr:zinc ABC transporter substrate-binding protein [Paenibacillus bouchesdurhonensis]
MNKSGSRARNTRKRIGSKGIAAASLLLAIMMVISACGAKGNSGSNGAEKSEAVSSGVRTSGSENKLNIQVSFYPMYEFTRQVAGDLAEVEMLVPSGVEPHDWEPAPRDIAKLEDADVFIYNGAGMEGWVEQVLSAVSSDKLITIEASHGLDIIEEMEAHDHHDDGEHGHAEGEAHDHTHDHADGQGHNHAHEHAGDGDGHEHDHTHDHADGQGHNHAHEHAGDGDGHEHDHTQDHAHGQGHNHAHAEDSDGHNHSHGGLDPHVWLSPALAIKEVRNIEAGLSQAAPEHIEQFNQHADAYVAKLEALDQEFRDTLTTAKRKDFITQHAAFGYLAREYGLRQVPIAGLSPDLEPSAAKMAEIVKFARENKVKTIFFETLVSSKVAETISKEIGAKAAVLHTLEGVTEEDLNNNMDYIAIMRQNLAALQTALNE